MMRARDIKLKAYTAFLLHTAGYKLKTCPPLLQISWGWSFVLQFHLYNIPAIIFLNLQPISLK